MVLPHRPSRSDDEDLDDEDEEEEEESYRRARRRRPRRNPSSRPPPVRRWRGPEDDEDEEVDSETPRAGARPHWLSRERHPVFWRARDSLYFEPLVALAVIVVLLSGLYAYTQNWPPVYVVESDSMQHGPNDILGLINTGDLVLAEKVDASTIVPYVVGLQTSYSTYGEYGDVVLYHPNGGGGTPVIHRAIVYLSWNPSSSSYDASELNGLPCGSASNAVYATPGTLNDCGTTNLTGTLDLYHIGWESANVALDLSSPALGDHSGFVTMGDNNVVCTPGRGCTGEPDQEAGTTPGGPAISELVEPSWVIGVARGMIPWFGSLKLLFEGNTAEVPSQSWEFMGLTITGAILLAFGVHYALRVEGIETPLRKEEEDEAEGAKEGSSEGRGRARQGWGSLRPWRREPEDEDEEEGPPRRSHRRVPPKEPDRGAHRGRPRPRVRRSKKSAPKASDDEL